MGGWISGILSSAKKQIAGYPLEVSRRSQLLFESFRLLGKNFRALGINAKVVYIYEWIKKRTKEVEWKPQIRVLLQLEAKLR